MRREVGAICVAVYLLAAVEVLAQAKPDFSGTWVLDTTKGSPADSALGMQGHFPKLTIAIKQTERTLTFEDKTAGGPGSTTVYKLDGSESRNPQPVPGSAGKMDLDYRSTWVGDKLVTTIAPPGSAGSLFKETLYLDGNELIQETDPGESDASQVMAPPGAKLKLYFKRG